MVWKEERKNWGVNLIMPVKSEAQRRLMYAALAGKTNKAKKSVAKEYLAAPAKKNLPEKVKSK